MNAEALRKQTEAMVAASLADLKAVVGGDFSPGYFNRAEVLREEAAGLSVCDAVLGHVLEAQVEPDLQRRASDLIERVATALVPTEVESSCHNLHSALLLMLDRLGYPAVNIWGSVNVVAVGTDGFVLMAGTGSQFQGHRPGHSWLATPTFSVVDIALRHQHAPQVGDSYDKLRNRLPRSILVEDRESGVPPQGWYRAPGSPFSYLDRDQYAEETKYANLIGWTRFEVNGITVRYLPGAVALPGDSDLNEVDILVGGKRAGDFFDAHLVDLL